MAKYLHELRAERQVFKDIAYLLDYDPDHGMKLDTIKENLKERKEELRDDIEKIEKIIKTINQQRR